MRIISLALSSLLLLVSSAPIWAGNGTIKGDDYPVVYEVMDNGKKGGAGDKSCSMVLRDQSQTKVAINVSRKGVGACHVLDSGKTYHGRVNEKKNEIEWV